jgi:hypothetical protein
MPLSNACASERTLFPVLTTDAKPGFEVCHACMRSPAWPQGPESVLSLKVQRQSRAQYKSRLICALRSAMHACAHCMALELENSCLSEGSDRAGGKRCLPLQRQSRRNAAASECSVRAGLGMLPIE